jgi:hypothetical protein
MLQGVKTSTATADMDLFLYERSPFLIDTVGLVTDA